MVKKKTKRYPVSLSIESIYALNAVMSEHVKQCEEPSKDKFYDDFVKTIPKLEKIINKHKETVKDDG